MGQDGLPVFDAAQTQRLIARLQFAALIESVFFEFDRTRLQTEFAQSLFNRATLFVRQSILLFDFDWHAEIRNPKFAIRNRLFLSNPAPHFWNRGLLSVHQHADSIDARR